MEWEKVSQKKLYFNWERSKWINEVVGTRLKVVGKPTDTGLAKSENNLLHKRVWINTQSSNYDLIWENESAGILSEIIGN